LSVAVKKGAGDSRIACELSLLEWGQQQEPTEGLSETGRNLLLSSEGRIVN
jgi:hypothetical protein